MEEELQKRNTDCVYFLASPLTCKKGVECEYRHSEMARLNPRDCWYWLAGSCWNPSCAFRHPPLDGRLDASTESTHYQSAAVPVNKTNVPCHFYFSGYCNKGERCLFLHGPEDGALPLKSLKATSGVPHGPSAERETFVESDKVSAPVVTNLQSKATESTLIRASEDRIKAEIGFHGSTSNGVSRKNISPRVSTSPSPEAAIVRSNSPQPAGGLSRRSPDAYSGSDQRSDDQVEGHVKQEEWPESSPGFDVLVEDGSEEPGYEDNLEYLLHQSGSMKFNDQYLGYDIKNNDEYDPAYHELSTMREDLRDSHDPLLDTEYIYDYIGETPGHRESLLDNILPYERKTLRTDTASSGRHRTDLRDYLKKRRMVDGHSLDHFSVMLESSHMNYQNNAMPQRVGSKQLHPRLASQAKRDVAWRSKGGRFLHGTKHQGTLRHTDTRRPRQLFKRRQPGKQRHLLSEVQGWTNSRKRKSHEDLTAFTGPKTLTQLKEEKRKAQERGYSSETTLLSGRSDLENFQGPKALGEILKGKRLRSVVDGFNHRD